MQQPIWSLLGDFLPKSIVFGSGFQIIFLGLRVAVGWNFFTTQVDILPECPHLELGLLLQYPVLCWPLPLGPETGGLLRVCQNAVSSSSSVGNTLKGPLVLVALHWNGRQQRCPVLSLNTHILEKMAGHHAQHILVIGVCTVFISLLCIIYIAVYKESRRHGDLCFFSVWDVFL